jgi:hypothetical protein
MSADATHDSIRKSMTAQAEKPDQNPAIRNFVLASADSIVPPALWGLKHALNDQTVKRVTHWFDIQSIEIGQNEKLAEDAVSEISDEVAELTKQLETNKPVLQLQDAVIALSATHALAALGQLNLCADSGKQLLQLAEVALDSESIDGLLMQSFGLEIGLLLACSSRDKSQLELQQDLAENFEAVVEENLDADGWPESRLLEQLASLVGCWSRIFAVLQAREIEINGSVRLQLEWFVRQCLRMKLNCGSMIFDRESELSVDDCFWKTVASMSNDPDDAVIVQLMNKSRHSAGLQHGKKTKLKPAMLNKLVDPYNVSEWASSFLLRSTWRNKSPRVAVDFSDRHAATNDATRCFTEIARSVKLISGQTIPEIQVGGELATIDGSFEVVCEVHDNDLDYIEVQAELSTGGRLNRQWLLSRTDKFLLLADSVVLSTEDDIEYRCSWPLAPGVATMSETETREVYLQDISLKKIQALVLPLALPEWKAERFDGSLQTDSDSLVLNQKSSGQALFAPLVFDLKPNRSKKKRTWRALTVAEDRKAIGSDQGVAYRFQLNNRQWFFYRALASTGNRTFLGQNVVSEFAFYRFHSSGKVTSLINVE